MAKKKKADPATKEMVVQADQQQETRKPEPLMYVGPTIPGVAIQNRVYNGLPEGLQEAMKEVPEFGNLLVPVADYPKAEAMLRTRKGFVASAYRKVAGYKKGGNN